MIPRKTGDSDRDDDADVMFGSGASQLASDVTLTKKDDEDELFNHLQYVLDKNDDAGNNKDIDQLAYRQSDQCLANFNL